MKKNIIEEHTSDTSIFVDDKRIWIIDEKDKIIRNITKDMEKQKEKTK